MTEAEIKAAVVGLGVLALGVGALCAVRPATMDSLLAVWQQRYAMLVAIVLRLFGGLILLAAAPECRWTGLVRSLGILLMFSALLLPVLGRRRVDLLVARFSALSPVVFRVWGITACAIGGALIYAGWV